MTPRQRIAKMRVATFEYIPYLSTYVYSLVPVPKEGLGTMAVDRHANMYFDPEYVSTLGIDAGAYVVAHETLHIVLRHHARAVEIYGTHPTDDQQYAMNVAADLVVEQALSCMRWLRPENALYLGCDCTRLGITLDFPPGLRMEEYYALIQQAVADQPGQSGSTTGDEGNESQAGDEGGEPQPGGSCADGVTREYEDGSDGSWEAFGESQAAEQAAAAIEKAEQDQPGSVPGSVREAIKSSTVRVRDPWGELRAAVATSVSSPVGGRQQTYRRLSRKQMPTSPIRLRGYTTTAPNAVVILDTSGSMLDGEMQDRALACIAAGLRKLSRFKVIAGDMEVRSRKSVSSVSNIEWVGGGGTDMSRLIEDVDASDKPDSIVIVTDCETGWPSRQTHARLVIASTSSHEYWTRRAPKWARLVTLAD